MLPNINIGNSNMTRNNDEKGKSQEVPLKLPPIAGAARDDGGNNLKSMSARPITSKTAKVIHKIVTVIKVISCEFVFSIAAKRWEKGRKKMFYLTTHSAHFIYGYMASEMVKNTKRNFIKCSVPLVETISLGFYSTHQKKGKTQHQNICHYFLL